MEDEDAEVVPPPFRSNPTTVLAVALNRELITLFEVEEPGEAVEAGMEVRRRRDRHIVRPSSMFSPP